jgi:LuxR family maltose regulon positive regulatory protein
MRNSLLSTKNFIPPARANFINRHRLFDKLDAGLNHKLTLISAPAGFGKTTLVSSWINQLDTQTTEQAKQKFGNVKTAWVSIDERDNDPALFWRYIIAAFQTITPRFGQNIQTMLNSATTFSPQVVVTMLLNEFVEIQQYNQVATQFLLVLDDYHLITTQTIHDSLNFMLDHLPPLLHVVITTRADPPLKFSYRHGRSEVIQIRAADLSFRSDESAEFLNGQMQLDLPLNDIETLGNRTEGWIAGLQLAALSLQEQVDKHKFVLDFAGDDRYIADYLIDEVLQTQPDHIQDFLLRTSILNQLSSPLCTVLTGQNESQSILDQLERYNLFLSPLDNRREWYRYHSLFAELLRQRLRDSFTESEITRLHQQASQWYQQREVVFESVDHAMLAKDFPKAAQLIENWAGEIFQQFKLNALVDWIESLPQSIFNAQPVLSMIYAWALLALGKIKAVEDCLNSFEKRIGVRTENVTPDLLKELDPETRGAINEVIVIRSVIAINQFNIQKTLKFCQAVESYLKDNTQPHLFNPALSLRTVVYFNLGMAHEFSGDSISSQKAFEEAAALSSEQKNANILTMSIAHLGQLQMLQGNLHQAEKTYQQALKLGAEVTGQQSPLAAIAEIGLGNLFYEWNDLEKSESHFKEGIELANRWRHSESLLNSYLGLARLKLAQGDTPGAFAMIQDVRAILEELGANMLVPIAEAVRARMWVSAGRLTEVEDWIEVSNLRLDGELSYLQENDYITFVRLLIARKNYRDAESLIARLLEFSGKAERNSRVLELMILQSIVKQEQGNTAQAEEVFIRALKMAEPQGYHRLFLDDGDAIASLLYQVISNHDNSVYAERLLKALGSQKEPGGDSPETLIEPLSEREIDILTCLAEGLSNREIAHRLTISLSTVKTHTRNIYNKLGVNSRTQAIAQARAWGIISSS